MNSLTISSKIFLKKKYDIFFRYCDKALFAGEMTLKIEATLLKQNKYPSLFVPDTSVAIATKNLAGLKNLSREFLDESVLYFLLNSRGKFDIILSGLARVRHNDFSLCEIFILTKIILKKNQTATINFLK